MKREAWEWADLLFGCGLLVAFVIGVVNATASERSGKWPDVRKSYVAEHPACEACGLGGDVQVHHVKPVTLYPEKDLDKDNLITLCPRCHMTFGHLGHTRAHNPLVRQDAARHRVRVETRPYTREEAIKFEQRFATAP